MVTMGNVATPMKTEKQHEVSQALKCMSKRKKSLYAQSRNELHCKSLGAEKSRMCVRRWNGTGTLMQISSSQTQPLSSFLSGHTRGVCPQWVYLWAFTTRTALVIQKAVQETAMNLWRGAFYEGKELNASKLVEKVLYRRELCTAFQINTPAMEKKLMGLYKWNWLTIDKAKWDITCSL